MIRPDARNKRSLLKFFEENKHMRHSEMAQVCGVSIWTINHWLRKLGMNKGKPRFFKENLERKKNYQAIEDPKIWMNKEWFVQKYVNEKLSCKLIGKMIKRDPKTVWQRLKRYGIIPRTFNEEYGRHPCYNRQWIEEHYVIQGITLARCAELANVNRYTIYNWLIRYNIPVREVIENFAGERNPQYGKKPVNALNGSVHKVDYLQKKRDAVAKIRNANTTDQGQPTAPQGSNQEGATNRVMEGTLQQV